ncbi:tocopherol O-methyltransferase, chloroplastic-like isoform X2 [Olea europaea var. sylvestris]|uniref:Gamma-tocopherol methyltransferase n=1 Tax=Olea europaea subsp. europaea TaxID=158383 RepID=A0A8S0S1T3_OLEEU|nr:tocopherol O-methyltransferase, chloroplastic-like isoform X2 [Olea europaea var. sylvestris]CAA2985200.1 gamma-tocopherol methyltransferase [Olea europaea subsp. europaea]
MVGSCSSCKSGTTLQWAPGHPTFISRVQIIGRNEPVVQVLSSAGSDWTKDFGTGIRIRKRRYITAVSGSGGGRRMRTTVNAAATETLQKGIAEFYDESSGIWENIWGDHMHHGFYEPDSSVSLSDHRSAQIRMIEEALRFASVSDDPMQKPGQIVDVGCGIGGSSRYLARKYEARSQGITLSPVQAQRAQALAAAQGLDDKVSFQVADALNQPFQDGQFDLVWSMESGEHMPDKSKFVNELARVAAPGGTIIIVTWCHRNLSPTEESLRPEEKELLNKICDAFYLPAWCSTADYVKLLESLSLQDIKAADWSAYVAPFWPAVIKSALTWKGIASLLRSGWKTIKGALAMPFMIEGYKKGLIKFAIITCRKPVS